MLLRISLIAMLSMIFITKSAMGADGSEGFSSEEKLIRQKIRTRSYMGGRDEEPLKVQAQLPAATRKVLPALDAAEATENNKASPADPAETND